MRTGQFIHGHDAIVRFATLMSDVGGLRAVPVSGRRVSIMHIILQ